MKTTKIFTLGAILLCVAFASCEKKEKTRIETKFENYTRNNFANPKDLQEIVTVHKIDSIDYGQLLSSTVETYNKAKELRDSLTQAFYKRMPETPTSIVYKSDVQDALQKNIAITKGRMYDIAFGTTSAKKLQEILDSLPQDRLIQRTYEIKAKIKGETELVTYYAEDWMGMDSVDFSRTKFQVSDMPELHKEISTLIETTIKGLDGEKELSQSIIEVFKQIDLNTPSKK